MLEIEISERARITFVTTNRVTKTFQKSFQDNDNATEERHHAHEA
jgi:hypothetical protein